MSKLTHEQILGAFARSTVSMEENDLNINIQAEHEGEQVDEDQVPLDTSDAPETAELDVADAIDETEEELDGSDDVVDVVESLESLRCSLEAIQEQGAEFTSAAALLTQVAVDNAVSRLPGLSASAIGVPSMEDFDYAPSTSLTVSIEKIGESIGAGMKAAGAFIKKIWEKIKAFFGRIFDASKAAEHKNKQLITKIGKIGGDTKLASGATVNVPGVVGFQLKASDVKKTAAFISEVNHSVVKTSDFQTVALTAQDERTTGDSNYSSEAIITIFNGGLEKYGKQKLAFGDMTFETSGRVITMVAHQASPAKELRVPSVSELHALAKANEEIIKEIIDIRKQEGRHKKLNESVESVIVKMTDGATKRQQERETKYANNRTKIATDITKAYNQRISFELNVIGKALSAANALNNVIASCVSKYGKANN